MRVDLQLFSEGQLVDGVGHVRVLGLRCSTVSRHMEVSWYLKSQTHSWVKFVSVTPSVPLTHLVNQ